MQRERKRKLTTSFTILSKASPLDIQRLFFCKHLISSLLVCFRLYWKFPYLLVPYLFLIPLLVHWQQGWGQLVRCLASWKLFFSAVTEDICFTPYAAGLCSGDLHKEIFEAKTGAGVFWCCVQTELMRGVNFFSCQGHQEESCPLRHANINLRTKDCGCRGGPLSYKAFTVKLH